MPWTLRSPKPQNLRPTSRVPPARPRRPEPDPVPPTPPPTGPPPPGPPPPPPGAPPPGTPPPGGQAKAKRRRRRDCANNSLPRSRPASGSRWPMSTWPRKKPARSDARSAGSRASSRRPWRLVIMAAFLRDHRHVAVPRGVAARLDRLGRPPWRPRSSSRAAVGARPPGPGRQPGPDRPGADHRRHRRRADEHHPRPRPAQPGIHRDRRLARRRRLAGPPAARRGRGARWPRRPGRRPRVAVQATANRFVDDRRRRSCSASSSGP